MALENVGESAILSLLEKIIAHFANARLPNERFGDFTIRLGYISEVKEGRKFND